MNSGGWYIFLFLFILGCCCQGVNQLGIWNVSEPNASYNLSTTQVNQVQQSASQNSPLTIFVIYNWIITFVTIIGSGVLAVLSLGLLFYGMGWPVGIVGVAVLQMIQLPANLVIFMWLFELWTGH